MYYSISNLPDFYITKLAAGLEDASNKKIGLKWIFELNIDFKQKCVSSNDVLQSEWENQCNLHFPFALISFKLLSTISAK